MKTFKEIEAFVRKAMEKEFCVYCNGIFTESIIVINDNIRITIESTNFGESLKIILGGNHKYGESKQIKLNNREKELFKLLRMDVSDYENFKVEEAFDNFFKRDPDKPTTIDELQDE